ncbi:MAG: UDP-glucose/GDP-mannose dehydrogenase family protein [Bacteroidota bacterium]
MHIAVIGAGYVGLVVGTCFAESGNHVVCVDIDSRRVRKLQRGVLPIYEPGLQELLVRNMREKRLSFTKSLEKAVDDSPLIFIALPTPASRDGRADLKGVLDVSRRIGKVMKESKTIVLKSTVPVGTCDRVRKAIAAQTSLEFDVIANPEFLKQGAAVNDFLSPDRVVVGTRNERAAQLLHELYKPFMRTRDRFLLMDERSAELTKYAANSILATKISFINEIANLCDRVGADVDMVRRGLGADPRIGPQFLFPGVGFGGSCFAKDLRALLKTAADVGFNLKIPQAVREINEWQRFLLFDKMRKHFRGRLKGKTIAIWGLAFKPRTDDVREAPAIAIIQKLLSAGAVVQAHDPAANKSAQRLLGSKVKIFDNGYRALKGAHALAVLTEWNEFRYPDFLRMKALMRRPVIFDGRNIYEPGLMREHGFTYFGVGRPEVNPSGG